MQHWELLRILHPASCTGLLLQYCT